MNQIYSVIIIDDNESLSYVIRDYIEKVPHFEVVGIAHNGEAGIELINEKKPNLVILDIIMPKADGLSVLEHFQHEKDVNFIILSGLGHDLVTKRAVNLGAMYYLIKPFDMQVLLDRMNLLQLGKSSETTRSQLTSQDYYIDVIREEISLIGVPMHIKGYQYIVDAVSMVLFEDDSNLKITKNIYPAIANNNNTTPTSVERAIRNAIEITINRGDKNFLYDYFNHEILNDKITNKEFVVRIANAVKRNI